MGNGESGKDNGEWEWNSSRAVPIPHSRLPIPALHISLPPQQENTRISTIELPSPVSRLPSPMNPDAFNLSIRKFLKHFGVTAQREIEQAVQQGLANGTLRGTESIPVRATLVLDGLLQDFHVDGEITLDSSSDDVSR
jgi:hypothetical protein